MRRCEALVLLLTGCSAVPVVSGDWHFEVATPAAAGETPDGAASILSGFDEPGRAEDLGVGDRALYAVEFVDGDEREEWWLLLDLVELGVRKDGQQLRYTLRLGVEPDGPGEPIEVRLTSDLLRLRVTRFDASGRLERSSEIDLPRRGLVNGFAARCAREIERREDGDQAPETETRESLRELGMLVLSCKALFEVVQRDELLADILWQIARARSLWSMIGAGGVRAQIDIESAAATAAAAGHPRWAPSFRLPLMIRANGEPALLVLAEVSEPRSPWNLGAGVLGLTARRPGESRAELRLRLVAARRAAVEGR